MPPETVPETVTDLFGESTEFPFAVTVTVPVLVVSPDAIVNVSALDNEKSPATAPAPAAAPTVTVTAALDTPESVAVTVDTPLLSVTDDDDRASVTVGSVSSSSSVNAAFDGADTPLPPETVPETVTDLSGESTKFPFAVTVTVPVLVVSPDAIVSFVALDNVKSPAIAPAPAAAATVTVTASLDAPESVAVTVDTPLLSETDDGDSPSATVGNASSSSSVNGVGGGSFAWPRLSDAVPESVTVLSGASIALSTAVNVTVPVLVVEPAAIVNLSALDSAKSPDTAGATGDTPTVTVTATPDIRSSRAVTVATPPFSAIELRPGARVYCSVVCGASSSTIVSVALDGATTPLPPVAVADTATCLLPDVTLLPFAVIVTVPVLVVSPDAIVNVSALDNVKSAATAPAPAAAPTVTVTASLDAPDSVAVTVDTPLLSEIDAGDNASAAVGNASSSVSVSDAPDTADTPLPPESAPKIITGLSGESVSLSFAVTVTAPVLVVEPAAIVNVSALDNVKSAATAPAPAAAPTVTVTASLDGLVSVAVTVETPPFSEIDADDRASATVGSGSSSVSVSGAPVTPPAPCALAAVALTVIERPPLPWCASSFTAVIVTLSVAFAVSPAAITIIVSEPTV